jgi:hypothetical protein
MDVAKVDWDVAIAIHVSCERLFQMFHLFFQTYVVNVFVWMLHILHTYMLQIFLSRCCICFVMAFQVFSGVFASV